MKLLNKCNIDKSITVFYFGLFFQHRLPGYKGGIFTTDGNVPFSCILSRPTGNANICFKHSLYHLQLQDVTIITSKYQLPFYPLEHMTFNNLINHMQNPTKESPHLTLPSILKEHVQYSIQQYASYIVFSNRNWRNKWDFIYLRYMYNSSGIWLRRCTWVSIKPKRRKGITNSK